MTAWLRYLIAFVVGCHGFTNIPFGLLVPARLIEWQGRSRLLGGAVSGTDSTRWFERCIWWREPPFSAAQPLSRSPCRPQGGGVRWPSSAQPLVWVPSWSSTTDRLDCWSCKVPSAVSYTHLRAHETRHD